ncbi:MAG: ligase-associated DNA damage response DEXH box helicase [Alphaproteobacteria bacterium]
MERKLPTPFSEWFAGRGWHPHAHQLDMLAAARNGAHALLIAPTGGGKTLAGFLHSLLDLAENGAEGLHTLYVSPLKALAVDVKRNLTIPISEMGLPIRVETRTGDTPQHKRQRQRLDPPHMLLTTPESLALLLSYPDAARYFRNLRTVVVDEIHAMADNKRGEQLALCLSRLHSLAPQCRRVGLSATVAWPEVLKAWLAPGADPNAVRLIEGLGGAEGRVSILTTKAEMPWSGHSGVHALSEVYEELKRARNTIVFVNTRGLSEIVFQELWRLNVENLPIALHHGSLSRENRRKVEAAMAAGKLRAVVATSSLDLGIDWAVVDLVIQMGAPKGVSRLIQRMGRSGHRLDTPSRAILVPGNRFEVLECRAALEAVYAQSLDGDPPGEGGLDILAQHIMIVACSGPFHPDALYAEIRAAAPYARLSRRDFDDVLAFVDHGGYALRTYERWRRLHLLEDGRYRTRSRRVVQRLRMNIGSIVEAETLKVRLGRGRILGEVEEYFAMGLEIGDSFIFAGRILRFEGIREQTVIASQAPGKEPKVPAFVGGRLPLTTHLADRVRAMLADPSCWGELPDQVQDWLRLQRFRSELPGADQLLVESFQRGQREFLVAYCFEGRNAHQTLGMLLTRRMERGGYAPLGFVATDYVIAVWGLNQVTDVEALFDEDMLGDDLEAWMDESSMLKRTFRNVAVIAGLIERNYPGKKKTGRQVTFSSDLIYDTLRQHEPDHILLRATRRDAAKGLTDIRRLGDMLRRAKGRIRYRRLERVSPLAVPVLLEIGKEHVDGSADDQLLGEAAADLIAEATGRP